MVGELPPALSGLYVRNGPNPAVESSSHWFLGNGMVHGLWLREGRAEMYARRYIDTPYHRGDVAPQAPPQGPVALANVSAVSHAGRLLALGEVGFPYQLSPEDLATIGPFDFDGALTTNMTAHPKIDPVSGEMCFFGYSLLEPKVTYHVADVEGRLARSFDVEVSAPQMMHDMAMTSTDAIFMDLPVDFDIGLVAEGFPYRWNPDRGARLGVLARDADADTTEWFDIDPCYVFHTIGAWREGNIVTLNAVRYPKLWLESSTEGFPEAFAWQWRIDTAARTVRETQLDDRPIEFPTINTHVLGSRFRYSYATSLTPNFASPRTSVTVKYDNTVASEAFEHPAGAIAAEPRFVGDPDRSSAEDGGWLLTFRHDLADERSELIVMDAQDVASGPVARVVIPQRIPFGFHGIWHDPSGFPTLGAGAA